MELHQSSLPAPPSGLPPASSPNLSARAETGGMTAKPALARSTDRKAGSTTPGLYMKRCRQRARVSIRAAAEAITTRANDRLAAIRDLAALEADDPGDYGRLVRALRTFRVFPFDFAHFTALAAATSDFAADADAQFGDAL